MSQLSMSKGLFGKKDNALVEAFSGQCENFAKLRWQLYWLPSPHYRRVSGSGGGYIATG